jgi:hypothetical protein
MVEVSGKVIAFLLFLFLVTVTIPQILKTNATSVETILLGYKLGYTLLMTLKN